MELTVEQVISILSTISHVNRQDKELESMRSGFVDGLNGLDSSARPGDLPEIYGSAYVFGVQMRDVIFWTHEIQADADRVP